MANYTTFMKLSTSTNNCEKSYRQVKEDLEKQKSVTAALQTKHEECRQSVKTMQCHKNTLDELGSDNNTNSECNTLMKVLQTLSVLYTLANEVVDNDSFCSWAIPVCTECYQLGKTFCHRTLEGEKFREYVCDHYHGAREMIQMIEKFARLLNWNLSVYQPEARQTVGFIRDPTKVSEETRAMIETLQQFPLHESFRREAAMIPAYAIRVVAGVFADEINALYEEMSRIGAQIEQSENAVRRKAGMCYFVQMQLDDLRSRRQKVVTDCFHQFCNNYNFTYSDPDGETEMFSPEEMLNCIPLLEEFCEQYNCTINSLHYSCTKPDWIPEYRLTATFQVKFEGEETVTDVTAVWEQFCDMSCDELEATSVISGRPKISGLYQEGKWYRV